MNPLAGQESDSDSDRERKTRSLASIYKETDPSPEQDDSELEGEKKTRKLASIYKETDPSPDNKSGKPKRKRVLNSPKSKGAASSSSSRLTGKSHQAKPETLESTYEETNPSSDKNSRNSTTTRVLRSHSAKSKAAASSSLIYEETDPSVDKKSDKSERKGVHAGPKSNRGSPKSQRANPNSSKAASSSSSPRLTRLHQASLEILDSSNQTKRAEKMPRGPFNLMPASLNTDFAFMEGDSSHQTEKREDMLEFCSDFSGSVTGNEKNEFDELNLNDLEEWWKCKESGGFDNEEDPPSPSKGNSLK